MTLTQKSRLKRRLQAYKTLGTNWVYLLETDFRGVFSPMAIKKGISGGEEDWISKVIDACNEKECLELNVQLDCYQIDKRIEK